MLLTVTATLILSVLPARAAPDAAEVHEQPRPSYHLVGWLNTPIPGLGQLLLGNPVRASAEFVLEPGLVYAGYRLSKRSPFTLDGVPEALPVFEGRARRGSSLASIETPVYADLLQEAGIKAHLVNVFESYREAARRQGVTRGIDQTSTLDLFLEPFRTENLTNPWVYAGIGATAVASVIDFLAARSNGLPRVQRISPYSNFLYAINYEFWQPIGSGAPEEMFFRGFLQHELEAAVPSAWFSVPMQALAFAFAHTPGVGRVSAGFSGLYLGYLANKYDGKLGPGITVHFWGVVLLGIETVLLSHEAQRTTPPAALAVQINY